MEEKAGRCDRGGFQRYAVSFQDLIETVSVIFAFRSILRAFSKLQAPMLLMRE